MLDLFLKPSCILLIIVLLIYFISKLVQKYSNIILKTSIGKNPDTRVSNTLYIDNNNKIVILYHKNHNYLMLIGKNNNLLLDKYEK